jgi:hypothetical protein
LQIEGEYVQAELEATNKNILSARYIPTTTTYGMAIYEYNKTINLFELDEGNTAVNKISPNQIGELSIKRMSNSYTKFGSGNDDYYKIRKYEIGSGKLFNADISSFDNLPPVNVASLRIVGGKLVIKKQKNASQRIYDIFYVQVHKEDVRYLPNPRDDLVYIIFSPASEESLYILNTNQLNTI